MTSQELYFEPEVPQLDLATEARHVWYVVKRRRFILLATFVIVVLSTAVYKRYQIPNYRATATLILEPNIPHLATSGEISGGDVGSFLQSEYEIIRSYGVARMAVGALGSGTGAEQPSEVAIASFQSRISVEPIKNSRLVKVTMTGTDPEAVARQVNTLVRMYIHRSLEDRRAASKDAFTFLSERLAVLRAQVAKSENELLEYKEQEDIVSLEKRQALVEERLSELTERHTEAALERSGLETALREARAIRARPELIEGIPQLQANVVLQQLGSELTRLELEHGRLSQKYKPKHPRLIQLQSQLDGVRARREIEIDKAIRVLEVEHRIRQQTEQGIRARLDERKRQSRKLAQQAIQYGMLKRDAESNRQMYDVLLQRLQETDFSGNITVNNIRIVDSARVPSAPQSLKTRRALINAVVGSLLLGLFLCVAVDYFDNALQSEHDVQSYLGAPVLGVVPRAKDLEAGRRRQPPEGGQARPSSAAVHRAYGDIKTGLDFFSREHVLRSLLVTSTAAGEGKTTCAIHLGKRFAHAGRRVLLVDADLGRPDIHRRLGLEPEAGLSGHLLDQRPVDEMLIASGTPGLRILPSGLIPPNPAELLGSPAMAALIEDLKTRFELVIVDSPPCSLGLEVAALSSRVDGIAFVVRAHSTPRTAVRKALQKLEHFQANLVGIVLNGLNPSSEDLGGDYGYYGYGAREPEIARMEARTEADAEVATRVG